MAQPNNAFSNGAERIKYLIHASIGDIDSLLQRNPNEPPATQAEPDTHVAQAAALKEALRRIEHPEGLERYYQDDNRNLRKTFDTFEEGVSRSPGERTVEKWEWIVIDIGFGGQRSGVRRKYHEVKGVVESSAGRIRSFGERTPEL